MRNTPLNLITFSLAVNFSEYASKQILLMRTIHSPVVKDLLQAGFEQVSDQERDCINQFGKTLLALENLKEKQGQQSIEDIIANSSKGAYNRPGIIIMFNAANGLAKVTKATHGLETMRNTIPEPYKGHRVTQSLRRHGAPDLALICARR